MRFLFILRGRPGLGHVTPGLAIANELKDKGHRIKILTYGNGIAFLKASGWPEHEYDEIDISSKYYDWPGLNPYDDGLRKVQPKVLEFNPDLIILGGEYLLPIIKDSFKKPLAMLYNPEIMEECERNKIAAPIFNINFNLCDFMVPMCESKPSLNYMDCYLSLSKFNTQHGPFGFNLRANKKVTSKIGRVILIGNGGGVIFPSNTSSYSSSKNSPKEWLKETQWMTEQSVLAVLEESLEGDSIYLFSCLGEEWNNRLLKRTNFKIKISPPSMDFYKILMEASIVISRGGAGFLSDLKLFNGHSIIWPLSGHDEQRKQSKELEDNNSSVSVCDAASNIYSCVKENMKKAQKLKSENRIFSKHTKTISDYFLKKLNTQDQANLENKR